MSDLLILMGLAALVAVIVSAVLWLIAATTGGGADEPRDTARP